MDSLNPQAAPQPAGRSAGVVNPNKPLHIILDQAPARGFARAIRYVLGVVFVLSLLMNIETAVNKQALEGDDEVREQYHSLDKNADDKVAIINIEGTILHSDGFIKKQIDHVRKDKGVKAIVLRVDSPGGTVTGSDYIYHHLKELLVEKERLDGHKIPMVVSMGGIAASGGYYVAMAAGAKEHTIYAEPTTWTGSIGVIIPHYDLSKLLEKWDVADDSISSHPLKQMGSLTHKVSKEELEIERGILKGLVDDSFARFKEIVLESRPGLKANEEWQKEVFTGRIFAADQAKQRGLVDDLGYIEDAIDQAITQAGLTKPKVRVVKYAKNGGLLDQLMLGADGKAAPGQAGLSQAALSQAALKSEIASLLNLTTPRAFYICSWLPGMDSLPGR